MTAWHWLRCLRLVATPMSLSSHGSAVRCMCIYQSPLQPQLSYTPNHSLVPPPQQSSTHTAQAFFDVSLTSSSLQHNIMQRNAMQGNVMPSCTDLTSPQPSPIQSSPTHQQQPQHKVGRYSWTPSSGISLPSLTMTTLLDVLRYVPYQLSYVRQRAF